MKRLVVNADDFGLSPAVNRGILDAFHNGIVTSTTMLVNLDHFEDALAIKQAHPELPVGVHLSLVWGRPVSDPAKVPSLVDRDGRFPTRLGVLARRYWLGQLSTTDVQTEFESQIRRFQASGLTPTHLDTHMHIHCLPGIFRALLAAATACGIEKVRVSHEESLVPTAGTTRRAAFSASGKRKLVGLLARKQGQRLAGAGLRSTDYFVGIENMYDLNSDALRFILLSLRDGLTELMCHPGFNDQVASGYSHEPPYRERELECLTDTGIVELAARESIEFTNYAEI